MVPDSAPMVPVSEGGFYERHAASRLVGFFPFSATRRGHYVPITVISSGKPQVLIFAVRPDGTDHQWREVPPRELSIALLADERFGRATGWIEAS